MHYLLSSTLKSNKTFHSVKRINVEELKNQSPLFTVFFYQRESTPFCCDILILAYISDPCLHEEVHIKWPKRAGGQSVIKLHIHNYGCAFVAIYTVLI
jgi:hypothetical protein